MFNPSLLPDVTSHHRADIAKTLKWVGMEKIAIPLLIETNNVMTDEVVLQQVSAMCSLYVNLNKHDAKGIHMSRLHLLLNKTFAGKKVGKAKLQELLESMVQSQQGIADNARLVLEFDLNLHKPALLSRESGYQSYSVKIDVELIDGKYLSQLSITIPYSSTCPCSASLSRQLYAEAINQQFDMDTIDKKVLMDWVVSDAGSIATPHSQRSYAYIDLVLRENYFPDLASLIFHFEDIIGTPVQTAVKRQDEQAFARLNAENLMFCEDAARRLKRGLDKMEFVSDYSFKVEHQESLHAHNAVVVDSKH